MRLGQIARKLSISPNEILGYLSTQNIILEENANSRLEPSHVTIILKKFAPQLIGTFDVQQAPDVPLAIVSSPEPAEALPVISDGQVIYVETPAMSEEIVQPIMGDENQEEQPALPLTVDSNEVIKAPKVELSGLKVLGKIDLPELKKKEASSPEASEDAPKEPVVRRKYEQNNQRREHRSFKNPVSLQRERELREEEEKRKEKAERDKERKTLNYMKKVKMSPPTKAVRLFDEPVVEMTKEDMIQEPKSWFSKLVKWLNS